MNTQELKYKPCILFLSNCYGEDRSAALIGSEVKKIIPDAEIIGAPLISSGEEYEKRGIPVLIKSKIPPSGGFPRSLIELLKDIVSLYIPIRYYFALRRIRAKISSVVVVGDVFLLLLGWLALHKKCVLIAQTKSDYQTPHYKIEEWLMRKLTIQVFTHDELTANNLRKSGVPALFWGNPMVDGLEKTQDLGLKIQASPLLIGILPGSRDEAYKNFLKILKVVELLSTIREKIDFAVAVPSTLNLHRLVSSAALNGWEYGEGNSFIKKEDTKVWLFYDAFVDVVTQSDIIIGLAGTANEQAAALGKPIVSFAGCGPQTSYKRMRNQEKLLGGCLKFITNYPDGVVKEIITLIDNKNLRESMGQIGIKRMGGPGGVAKIANWLVEQINVRTL